MPDWQLSSPDLGASALAPKWRIHRFQPDCSPCWQLYFGLAYGGTLIAAYKTPIALYSLTLLK